MDKRVIVKIDVEWESCEDIISAFEEQYQKNTQNMEEIWKDIKDWEGLYQVSNLGRVRSLDRYTPTKGGGKRLFKGQILVLRYDKDRYRVVHLRDASTKRSKLLKVHRLVAEAFIPNTENKPEIDHINGNREDNIYLNLRWCTNCENSNFPLAKTNRSKAITQSYIDHPELRQIRAEQFRKVRHEQIAKSRRNKEMA